MKISDFNISGNPIPEDIADKIEQYHLQPLRKVQSCLEFDIWVSAKSGYRSFDWEKKHGRKGNSQHCFYGKGATDITCDDFKNNYPILLEALIGETDYTRFAIYETFIHIDYGIQSGERWVFDSGWVRQYEV